MKFDNRPTMPEIISACCHALGIDATEFTGRGRSKEAVAARTLCVWLAREHSGASFPEIAYAMGRPNHSTSITQYRQFDRKRAAEPERWEMLIAVAEDGISRRLRGRAAPAKQETPGETTDDTKRALVAARMARADSRLAAMKEVNRAREADLERRIAVARERELGVTA